MTLGKDTKPIYLDLVLTRSNSSSWEHKTSRHNIWNGALQLDKSLLDQPDEIRKAIQTVIGDSNYKKNARRQSSGRSVKQTERCCIEALRRQFGPLETSDSEGRHLNTSAYYSLDIALAVIVALLILLFVINFVFKYVSRNIAELGFLTTICGNSVLIYLTGWMTKQIQGPYKRMIIIFAFLGLSFSMVEMIARPFAHSYNGALVYFSLAKEISGFEGVVTFLLALYAGLYAALISFVAVQFIFRYFILNNQDMATILFKGWKMAIWVSYSMLFGALWIFLCFFCGKFDEYSMDYTSDEMSNVYSMNINKTAGMIIVAYLIQYVIMIFCGTSMHFQMVEKLKHFSITHQRLQKQFFKTLVCQITVPTVLFHVPIVPVLFAPFLNMKMSFQSGIIYSLFNLYPPIDSFLLMYIVSDYRNALSKLFSRNKQVYTGSNAFSTNVSVRMS
ncbi:Protein CBR-STR-33 [Caenorhabditis briggsae]|uniref:Protein CBR-STR-33 n=1 Tax=Caenorhabditis briggsae TaxID=6238 RepID=A8WL14_CAEBR|nr:Protein CBR-STR-33 [Caenorhabditis briggsae]CAP21159.1 Protein CBR-STR-33 [Caenorhabditis briggsae]